MKIKSLSLRNFRNIEAVDIETDDHINFFYGKNAQGKTSVLEGLTLLSCLESFRSPKVSDWVRKGQENSFVSGEIAETDSSGNEWSSQLRVQLLKENLRGSLKWTRHGYVNQKQYKSRLSYLKNKIPGSLASSGNAFHTIIFNPADHEMVRGGPSLRRDFLDQSILSSSPGYLKIIRDYKRVLLQRNGLLRDEQTETSHGLTMFNFFTDQLVKLGAEIQIARLNFLDDLLNPLNIASQKIAPNQAKLSIVYSSKSFSQTGSKTINSEDLNPSYFAGQDTQVPIEHLELAFVEKLNILRRAEIHAKTTLVGPHRDDWSFIIGKDLLKGHGSQGETRTSLLALKLAEIEVFEKRSSWNPILLLDDISSELDAGRRKFLLDFLLEKKLQVFITSTEKLFLNENYFFVEGGKVSRQAAEKESLSDRERKPETIDKGQQQLLC